MKRMNLVRLTIFAGFLASMSLASSAEQTKKLPRVLIIGDSISQSGASGYTAPTARALQGQAIVVHHPGNALDTRNGLKMLKSWLGNEPYEVIHFNFGLHDIKNLGKWVPIDEYEKNLRELVRRLQDTKAKLIWASSTPVPDGAGRGRRNSDLIAYNAVAKKIMEEQGIPINDLYAFVLPQMDKLQLPRDVHFTDEGSDALAGRVTDSIRAALGIKLHFYILMGQSNMAGRGVLPAKPEPPDRRILVLNKKDEWAVAADPLHFDDASAGVGPGMSFARTMLQYEKDKGILIGLVPCAEGGTDLKLWEKDGRLFKNAVRRAKIASEQGTLKGVLWHQGENDTLVQQSTRSYGVRLAQMIADFREAAKAEKLSFVAGKLSPVYDHHPQGQIVNRALTDLPKKVPFTACADSRGLQCKQDGIHFSSEGQIELGKRYAEQMSKLIAPK